jgi:hypothetical protein
LLWGEGKIDYDGIRKVDEWGYVRGMEDELREKRKNIRNIIKEEGLWYKRVKKKKK